LIDPRAIVDPTAQLGERVEIGAWCVIGPDVQIGEDCQLAPHVCVKGGARLGPGNRLHEFCSLGAGEAQTRGLELGAGNVIREGVTIDAGSTIIGGNNLILPHAFVPAGAKIGDGTSIESSTVVDCDCPSYLRFGGWPLRAVGLNVAGLAADGFDEPAIEELRTACRRILDDHVPPSMAQAELSEPLGGLEPIDALLRTLASSGRTA